jgi:hypothetical protein
VFTVLDSCGNDTSFVVILTVEDNGPPMITEQALDTMVQCDGMGNQADLMAWIDTLGFAEAMDECGDVYWQSAFISTTNLCGNAKIDSFYFIAIDACGNRDSTAAQFEIIDTIDPTIIVFPKDTAVQCDGLGNMLDFQNWIDSVAYAEATDGCSNITWDTTLISSIADCGASRLDSFWFITIDGCGLRDSAAAAFEIIDTIPPRFDELQDYVLECSDGVDTSTAARGVIIPVEGCGSVTISYEDFISAGNCDKAYEIARVWTSTDECNLSVMDTQFISIVDTQAPSISCPGQLIAQCSLDEHPEYSNYTEFFAAGGIASDMCSLDTSSLILHNTSIEFVNNVQRVTRTYLISDSCGNTNTCDQIILLQDITDPIIECIDTFFVAADIYGDATVELDSFLIDTSDNCAVDFVEILQDSYSCGFTFNKDKFETVTLRVFDKAGNSAICNSVLVIACPCPLEPFLVCNDMINVSLSANCVAVISPDDVLEGAVFDCFNDYKVDITDKYGNGIGNKVDDRHVGQTLTVMVTDTIEGNRCWGKINVEDKSPPFINCQDTTISCFVDPHLPLPEASSESCRNEDRIEILSEEWVDFDCGENDELLGQYIRKVAAFDQWGNMRICPQTINIRKESLDSLYCPEIKTILYCDNEKFNDSKFFKQEGIRKVPIPVLENGQSIGLVDPPKLGDVFVDVDAGACNIMVSYEDQFFGQCGNTFTIEREWTFIDWCSDRDTTCTQFISILDTSAPKLILEEDILVQVAPHECKAPITLERPDFIEDCTDSESVKIFYNVTYFDYGYPVKQHNISGVMTEDVDIYLPIGTHSVEYTASDECWNVSHFTQTIEVEDVTPPTPVCDEHTAVTLDPGNCEAEVFAVDLSDGTHDNCCQQIHYAVASMDSIEYWTSHWQSYFNSCYSEYLLQEMQPQINRYIDEWINCFVFDDVITLSGCVSDSLVLRSYEACGMRPYDAHLFKGSTHQWYCFQKFELYAEHYIATLSQQTHYQSPKPDLDCHSEGISLIIDADSLALNMNDPIISLLYESRLEFSSLYSQCMIEVTKSDKEAPVCDELEDIRIYCDELEADPTYLSVLNLCELTEIPGTDFDLPWVQESGNGYYGGPLNADYDYDDCSYEMWKGRPMSKIGEYWKPIYCRFWLELDSEGDDHPHIDPRSLFEEPSVRDNCTPEDQLLDSTYIEGELDDCGEGHLRKVWIFKDLCGNETLCHQDLYIYHRSDFEVMFPEDLILNCQDMNDLSATLDGAGIPQVFDTDCEVTAISHVDTYLNDEEDGCYKIIRDWTVVDWCKYEPGDKVHEPDVIINDSLVASADRACVYRYLKDGGNGIVKYTQIIKVIDEVSPEFVRCQPDLVLCLEDDCGPLGVNLDLGMATDNCATPENLIYDWSLSQSGSIIESREDTMYSGSLDLGVYTLAYYVRDLCQNKDTCSTVLTIVDCKAPSPICMDGVVTVIMESTGNITIWANDLINKTLDNCSSSDNIKVSFSADPDSTSAVFSCEMMTNGVEEYFEVEVWVTDEEENQDKCITTVKVQDNDHCPDNLGSVYQVGGQILTKNNFAVPNTTVNFDSETENRPEILTDEDGYYGFGYLPMHTKIEIVPRNNTDLMKGVSTRDIVRIQKHLLGVDPFEDPDQYIAADINNSKSVSAIDIVDLRKVILGIYDEFPNNSSWRFSDKSSEMTMDNPFDIVERIRIQELQDESMESDFMGIKVGDVNDSYNNLGGRILVRDRVEHSILLTSKGDGSELELKSNIEDIEGFQFKARIPEQSKVSVIADGLLVESNYSVRNVGGFDEVTVSWNKQEMSHGEAVLLTLSGEDLDPNMIALDAGFENEAYHVSKDLLGVKLEIYEINDQFRLMQNRPNPFIASTKIPFYNPNTQIISIRVMDVVGKTIFTEKRRFSKGQQEFTIQADNWNYSGVVYYTIKTESESASGKMIKIN